MADKKTTKKNESKEEIGTPTPTTPEEEREISRRAEESANNPDATGQEYEEVK
jgi:hypothetical protein